MAAVVVAAAAPTAMQPMVVVAVMGEVSLQANLTASAEAQPVELWPGDQEASAKAAKFHFLHRRPPWALEREVALSPQLEQRLHRGRLGRLRRCRPLFPFSSSSAHFAKMCTYLLELDPYTRRVDVPLPLFSGCCLLYLLGLSDWSGGGDLLQVLLLLLLILVGSSGSTVLQARPLVNKQGNGH